MGIDWGRVRVGVALSDEMGLLAHPLATLQVSSLDALVRELSALAASHGAEEIVLGLPRNMDGSEGESADTVRRVAASLEQAAGRPVRLQDERLTTWAAERLLAEESPGRRSKRKPVKDQVAACLILQAYLDARQSQHGH
jgi:putative holliday junction resolvase